MLGVGNLILGFVPCILGKFKWGCGSLYKHKVEKIRYEERRDSRKRVYTLSAGLQ